MVSAPPAAARPRTDQILDITLWLEIAVLTLVLLQWHPPVHPFPPIFVKPHAVAGPR